MSDYGYCKGEICNRNHCTGIIEERERKGCSCHINPPCSSCTEDVSYCPVCGWDSADEVVVINDYAVTQNKHTGVAKSWKLRDLDSSKLDYHSKSHTHFSMIKEGFYPEGMTQEEVREKVKGTFGGRFEFFGNGKFKFIAYTD